MHGNRLKIRCAGKNKGFGVKHKSKKIEGKCRLAQEVCARRHFWAAVMRLSLSAAF